MLGKTQSDTLRHFDVPRRTLFEARNLTLVQCLGAERSNARVEAPFDQIVVHAVVCAQPKRSEAKQSERQEASSGERQGDRSIDRSIQCVSERCACVSPDDVGSGSAQH